MFNVETRYHWKTLKIYKIIPCLHGNSKICKDLLNDLDRLPKQTMSINAEGNKGETRSINIPVWYRVGG